MITTAGLSEYRVGSIYALALTLLFQVDNLQFDIETIMMKNSMYLYEDGNAGSTQQINLVL
jgi:hypothetical protein